MVHIDFLRNLSYSGAVHRLMQKGYLSTAPTEDEDDTCDKLYLHPYLSTMGQKIIDQIDYAEYCNLEIDDEYRDGRMTWVPGRTDWIRRQPLSRRTQ